MPDRPVYRQNRKNYSSRGSDSDNADSRGRSENRSRTNRFSHTKRGEENSGKYEKNRSSKTGYSRTTRYKSNTGSNVDSTRKQFRRNENEDREFKPRNRFESDPDSADSRGRSENRSRTNRFSHTKRGEENSGKYEKNRSSKTGYSRTTRYKSNTGSNVDSTRKQFRRNENEDREFKPRNRFESDPDNADVQQPFRPGLVPREDEPDTPKEFDENTLPGAMRAELKSLPKDLAETIGAHLWAAGTLIDEDPALAYRHAEAAKRRAPRIPIVREATAETAYEAGEYAVALREYRALRRMRGGDNYLAIIADCERALKKPREALELISNADRNRMDDTERIELVIVEAGARVDLGQLSEAMRILRDEIDRHYGPRISQARLRYAYADLLLSSGEAKDARMWFVTAAKYDQDRELDIESRIAEIDGVNLDEDHKDDDCK